MKGVILAGDSGTKLHPLTLGVPKQLLPLYNTPMIFFPLQTLLKSGVTDILVITKEDDASVFEKVLEDGEKFGVNISYACQNHPEGMAQAIMIGRDFIGNDAVCLTTGDTVIISKSIEHQLSIAYKAAEKSGQATIFVKNDEDPDQYGVVVFGQPQHKIEIKGRSNKSYYSITGLYVFPNSVLEYVNHLVKSERNRYEITALSKIFHERNKLQIQKLSSDSIWLDTNSFDSILNSGFYIKNTLTLR